MEDSIPIPLRVCLSPSNFLEISAVDKNRPSFHRGGLVGSAIGVLSDFRALSHMRCLIDTRRFIDLAKLRAVLVQCVLNRQ